MKSKSRVLVMALCGAFTALAVSATGAFAVVTPATDDTIAQTAMDSVTGKAGLVAAVIVGSIAGVALGRLAWVGLKVVGKAIGKIG